MGESEGSHKPFAGFFAQKRSTILAALLFAAVAAGVAFWVMERERSRPRLADVAASNEKLPGKQVPDVDGLEVGEMPFLPESIPEAPVRPFVEIIQKTSDPVPQETSAPEKNVVPEAVASGSVDGFTDLHGESARSPPLISGKPVIGRLETSGSSYHSASNTDQTVAEKPVLQLNSEPFSRNPPAVVPVENPPPDSEERKDVADKPDPSLRVTTRLQHGESDRGGFGVDGNERSEEPEKSNISEDILFEEELPQSGYQEQTAQRDLVAVQTSKKRSGKRIALVIDDLGYNKPMSKAIFQLPADLTLAVLPGGSYSRELADLAFSLGRELILHQPMQPMGYPSVKPGYGALYSSMNEGQILEVLRDNFQIFPHAKGLNNHMGSQLTTNPVVMDVVMKFLKSKNLYFLDSRTSTQSVAESRAHALGVVATRRDVFIDNVPEKHSVLKKLGELVSMAQNHGRAVGIGHPHQATLDALREWLPTLSGKGIEVARLSHFLPRTHVAKGARPAEIPEVGKIKSSHGPASGQMSVPKRDQLPSPAVGLPALHQTTGHAPKIATVAE
ncbi:MAG: hypothetical protein HW380_2335 [Magnetococcales bacterium]|nr:hypothetical protein [Magnetococcales bacterium]HIJ83121.1 divergent polysaccharide deacetylase family protein [Magnetococcales bacterium]